MKNWTLAMGFSLLVVAKTSSLGQGTFANLNFESPILPIIPYANSEVPIANALPGWQGYLGTFQTGRVVYNTVSIGAAAITLQGPGSPLPILQGSYTVFLQPAFPSGLFIPALAQTGTVPASAVSIRFYSLSGGGNPLTSLTFAGQQIPVSFLSSGPNYDIWGGDISPFANQSGELRFTGGGYLDNIFFSNQQIPEPSTFGFFGLSALLFGYRSRLATKS